MPFLYKELLLLCIMLLDIKKTSPNHWGKGNHQKPFGSKQLHANLPSVSTCFVRKRYFDVWAFTLIIFFVQLFTYFNYRNGPLLCWVMSEISSSVWSLSICLKILSFILKQFPMVVLLLLHIPKMVMCNVILVNTCFVIFAVQFIGSFFFCFYYETEYNHAQDI